MKKRRALLISQLEPWSMAKGSGAPSLHETLRGYSRAGWEIVYVTNQKSHTFGGSHETNFDSDLPGVRTVRFEVGTAASWIPKRLVAKYDRLFGFPSFATRCTKKLLQEGGFDLLYGYEESGILAVQQMKRLINQRTATLSRFQGTVMGTNFRSWTQALRKIELLKALRAPADLWVMTDDGTDGLDTLLHWNPHCSKEQILFARNGIDLSLAAKKPEESRSRLLQTFSLDPENIYLATVCRLAYWKRVDRGILALSALHRDNPRLHMIVVGDGEARSGLEEQANRLGVADRVHFLGAQPRTVVSDVMNSADIFLSLNDLSNCGNPLFEAQLCGRCVVTLDTGKTGTVIRDGANGRLLPPDDSQALVKAIYELVTDTNRRAKLQEGARDWAVTNLYSWDVRMDKEIKWVENYLSRTQAN